MNTGSGPLFPNVAWLYGLPRTQGYAWQSLLLALAIHLVLLMLLGWQLRLALHQASGTFPAKNTNYPHHLTVALRARRPATVAAEPAIVHPAFPAATTPRSPNLARHKTDGPVIQIPRHEIPATPPTGNTVSSETAGPIDLEAMRRFARMDAASTLAASRPAPGMQSGQEPALVSPISRAISQAARPDCRTAHAGMGLLSIPFLLKDTLTGSGCKW